jgi:hypothetical protein
MSGFPNTKGQKLMIESDPVVIASDQILNVRSGNVNIASENTLNQVLGAVQSQRTFEATLAVDNNNVTWLEIRIWNTGTSSFNAPQYYLAGSNVSGTPAQPLTYINPNTYLSMLISNTMGINLESTQQSLLTGITNINNKLVNGNDIGDVTINNGSGANAVNIQDGGNSITVDGTVSLSTSSLNALESITVQNGVGAAAVNIQDGGNSITVDGGVGFQREVNILRLSGVTGSTPAGIYSVTIESVGNGDAIVGGSLLKSGEFIKLEGGGINNTLGAITYDTTPSDSELLITYLS